MPSKYEVEIVIIGAGSNRVGLWLLGFIAKVFRISLEVCPTPLALDGAKVAPHCNHGYNGLCPVCAACQTPPRQ